MNLPYLLKIGRWVQIRALAPIIYLDRKGDVFRTFVKSFPDPSNAILAIFGPFWSLSECPCALVFLRKLLQVEFHFVILHKSCSSLRPCKPYKKSKRLLSLLCDLHHLHQELLAQRSQNGAKNILGLFRIRNWLRLLLLTCLSFPCDLYYLLTLKLLPQRSQNA